MSSGLQFRIYTSTWPKLLTKVFGLAADGKLTKTTAASMAAGTAQRAAAADLHARALLLGAML